MAQDSHPVRNGIIATVVGGLTLSLFDSVRDAVFAAARWVWSGLEALWALAAASFALPGWLLLIIIVLAIITLVQAVRSLIPAAEEPEHLKYVEDQMQGAIWRWNWVGTQIVGLWGFCPTCDGQLVYDDSSCRTIMSHEAKTEFICENCQRVVATIHGGALRYAKGAVEREIQRRLRTGEHE